MRTITEVEEVYDYTELRQESKQVVKQWLLDDDLRNENFADSCKESLLNLFPESDLQAQYSLSYCQGDGFNIYGELYFTDMLDLIKNKFTSTEIDTLLKYFNFWHKCVLESNDRYSYCIINNQNITEYLECELDDAIEDKEISSYDSVLLEKFNTEAKKYLVDLCKDMENDGYEYLYNMSEDEIIDTCQSNEYEFLEDGTLY